MQSKSTNFRKMWRSASYQKSWLECLPELAFDLILYHLDLRDRFHLRVSREIKAKVDAYLLRQQQLIVTDDYTSVKIKWHFSDKPVSFFEIAKKMDARMIVNCFGSLRYLKISAPFSYDDLKAIALKLQDLTILEAFFWEPLVTSGDRQGLDFSKLRFLKVQFDSRQADEVMFRLPSLVGVCLRTFSAQAAD